MKLRLPLVVCLVFVSLLVQAEVMIPAAPELAAKAWILIDVDSGTVIAEHNADEPLAPASLTKMMTSYLIVDGLVKGRFHEQDQVLVSVNAWRSGGGGGKANSSMFAEVNSIVPLIDLLRGVIVQSGNDASIALAEYMSGSEAAFADVMNQQAEKLGMTKTHYINATGLPAEGHVTTARDLSLMGAAVAKDHPQYYPIYAEKEYTWNKHTQQNRNRLLWLDTAVDGIKTGHTDEAGYCLVTSAKRNNMRLVGVVLGTANDSARAQESLKLLNYGFLHYEAALVLEADQSLSSARLWGGVTKQVPLGVAAAVKLTLPKGAGADIKPIIEAQHVIKAPVKKGDVVGTVKVMLGDKQRAEVPLVVLESIDESNFFSHLWDMICLFFFNTFGG